MDLVTLLIGAAIAIPAILFLQHLASRYGDKRAARATEKFKAADPRDPAHVQAWGRNAIAFYRDPDALRAMSDGETPVPVDLARVDGWYVGLVRKTILSREAADAMSTEGNTVGARNAESRWCLIYDTDGEPLAQVGYMNPENGDTMTALLTDIAPGRQMPAPGKLPKFI